MTTLSLVSGCIAEPGVRLIVRHAVITPQKKSCQVLDVSSFTQLGSCIVRRCMLKN